MKNLLLLANCILLVHIFSFSQEGPAVRHCMEEGVPEFDLTWHHNIIETAQAWQITKGNSEILILYICPVGINWEHERIHNGYDNINRPDGEEQWLTWNGFIGNGLDDDNSGVVDDWRGSKLWITNPPVILNNNTLHKIYDPWNFGGRDGTWLGGIICGINTDEMSNNDFYSIAGGVNQKGISLVPYSYSTLPDGSHTGLWMGAIDYAIKIEADIILFDFTTDFITSGVEEKLQEAHDAGIFIIAPSGWSTASQYIGTPANFTFENNNGNESIFSVGGSTKPDVQGKEFKHNLSHYELYPTEDGDYLDLVAPAEKIYTTTIDESGSDDEYTWIQGNAASAAMVAATAGLMLSVNPELETYQIRDILRETAEKINDATNGGSYNYNWNEDHIGHSRECGYGRLNTYRAVCAALEEAPPLVYSDGDTWSTPKFTLKSITIQSGETLTISSTVSLGPNAAIIVEPGAKLILDGGKLTNYKFCDFGGDMWLGVEVHGDDELSQFPCNEQYNQGIIEIKNGGIIENAQIGVLISARTPIGFNDNKNGGIIRVSNGGDPNHPDAKFINNRQSIVFRAYDNYYINYNCDSISLTNNASYIKNTLFELNSAYLDGTWTSECIHLWEVEGITISGCTFRNYLSATPSGHGINAYAAGCTVDAICNSQQSPCPDNYLDKCQFINFGKGVNLYNSWGHALTVKNSFFALNGTGISLTNVQNASILFNEFNIGNNESGEGECEGESKIFAEYGIDMDNCSGFAIEENEFSPGASVNEYVGIRCKDSQTRYDIIYKNTFEGLDYGNFAEGLNRDIPGDDQRGLEFQCNNNDGNVIDFIVTTNDPNFPAQIRTFQGTQETEAGNTFSSGPQLDTEGHFKNEGTQVVDYFYHSNPPVYYTPGYVVLIDEAGENTCPSHYGGGGGGGTERGLVLSPDQKLQAELDYATNLSDYTNVKVLYENLKDGGNTEVLQNEIEMSWPQDMWELREELLGKSPHLSKEVLMTMADKTDVLPESVIFEILSANPDELRKEELISYLENKEQPLPEYMISILRQLAGGITYKTILLQDMAKYNAAKTTAAYDLIRSSLNDTVTDFQYLRNWLDNLDNMNADLQIVETYLVEGDYTSAQAMLDMIPSLYELQGSALEDYNDLKSLTEMRMAWKQQGRNIFELDGTEIATLVDYAENSMGKASSIAKGILEFAYGYNYCNCLPVSDSSAWKSSPATTPLTKQDHGLFIEATPNPAKTWVAFDYSLPVYADEAVLQITDMKGNAVTHFIINSGQGQQVWDIRNIEKGVYLYTIKAGKMSKSGKLIIE